MKQLRLLALSLISGISIYSTPALALSNLPTTAPYPDTVNLKTDCTNILNCATTIAELQSWVDGSKKPSSTSPLLVNVGPGTFKRWVYMQWMVESFV